MFFVGVRGFFLGGRGRGVGGRLREDGYRGFVADLLFVITCPFQLTYSISMCSSVKPVKREGDIGGGVRFVCVVVVVVVVFITGEGGVLGLFFFFFFFCFLFFLVFFRLYNKDVQLRGNVTGWHCKCSFIWFQGCLLFMVILLLLGLLFHSTLNCVCIL